jgi:hypothetical protein
MVDDAYCMAGIFCFPIFTLEFCNKLLEEFENIEKHKKQLDIVRSPNFLQVFDSQA